MKDIDPKITISEALEFAGGNQAALGRIVGVTRATVNGWVRDELEFLPPLHAYRFSMHRECNAKEAA